MAAALSRLVYAVFGDDFWLWLFVHSDDCLFLAGGKKWMECIVYPLFLLRVLGVPFSWPKLAAGFVVNWIGLEVNVREWSLGLSARRAAWVTGWLEAKLAAGKVRIGELVQALGRMQFAYGVLRWDRPFLAPLYTLASSYDPDETIPLPPFVAAAMQWLRDRLLVRRTAPCRRIEVSKKGVFRVDAKAEGPNVALGGWRPVAGPDGEIDLMACPWFALTLTPAEAPWAFDRGEPFRAIASLELLATVIGLMLFFPDVKTDELHAEIVQVTSHTDSLVSSAVVSRGSTTAFPLCLVAMEASAQMERLGLDLSLTWVPREVNSEADALSNLRFEGFDPSRRLEARVQDLPFLVLPTLEARAVAFYHQMAAAPERRRRRPPGKRAGLRETDPW